MKHIKADDPIIIDTNECYVTGKKESHSMALFVQSDETTPVTFEKAEKHSIVPIDILTPLTNAVHSENIKFMELIQANREKYAAMSPKHNRKKACILIGFHGITKDFTNWLRGNSFLGSDDYPESILIERGLMEVHVKNIYREVQYDCWNCPVSGNVYEGGKRIKTLYTPLFTEKGITYFRTLLADETLLKEEVEKIKLSNNPHSQL